MRAGKYRGGRRTHPSEERDPQQAAAGSAVEPSKRARKRRGGLLFYLQSHLQAASGSLSRLAATPVQSVMTCMVIGIALAFPATLYVVLHNAQQLSGRWDRAAEMSLFLQPQLEESRYQQLKESLLRHEEVREVRLISAEEALQEFRKFSGFSEVLDYLDANPLPPVAIVSLAESRLKRDTIAALVRDFEALPQVAQAQFDMAWLQRLNSIMLFGWQFLRALWVLLFLGVLLVVCHTIRIAIQGRREEIQVAQLVGGTNAYVRRPFLYTGCWYGGGGGLCAWGMVWLLVFWMRAAGQELALLYESNFNIGALSAPDGLLLCLSGALVGLLGAWLGVIHHLTTTATP